MRPQAMDIAVPPFSPGLGWIGDEPPPVERICARGPLLVQFIDAAHLSSVRTIPYVNAWRDRYSPHGLTVVGINSPRFPLTAEKSKLAAALDRLEVAFPVALDDEYRAWHDYGCRGWPSLFLWGRGGALRWFHFGEGEYSATEAAIQQELRAVSPTLRLPDPLSPLRPSDAPGALVARPTPELLPGGSTDRPWRPTDSGDSIELRYEAGGAWATADGQGTIAVTLDGGPAREIAVDGPGAYALVAHERHERHALSVRPSQGVSLYAIAFAAGTPAGD